MLSLHLLAFKLLKHNYDDLINYIYFYAFITWAEIAYSNTDNQKV